MQKSHVLSETPILSAILKGIGAHECLQKFIDDFRDDDSLLTLSKLTAGQISSRFGMSLHAAALFIAACGAPDRSRDTAGSASTSTALPAPLPAFAPFVSCNSNRSLRLDSKATNTTAETFTCFQKS
jgi:hypothetical protein